MQDAVAKEIPVGRGSLIIGTVVVAAILLGMFYSVQHRYGVTKQDIGWLIAFSGLLFAKFFLQCRNKPVTRAPETPGVSTLNTLTFTFVLVFLISVSQQHLEAVLAEVWPLLLGAMLSLFAALLYSVLFRYHDW